MKYLALCLMLGMLVGCSKPTNDPIKASQLILAAKHETENIDWIAKLKEKSHQQHFLFEIKCLAYADGFYGKAAKGPLNLANNGLKPKELGGIPFWFVSGRTQQEVAHDLFYEVDGFPEQPDTLESQAQEQKRLAERKLHCPMPIIGGDVEKELP